MFKSIYLRENLSANYISPALKSGCGEIIKFFVRVDEGVVKEMTFTSSSSQLTMKALDVLCGYMCGLQLKECMRLSKDDFLGMIGLALTGKRAEEAYLPVTIFQDWMKTVYEF